MSGLFGGGKTPKVAPIQPVKDVAPLEKLDMEPSMDKPEVDAASEDAKRKAKMRQGGRSTILTSALGVQEEGNIKRNTLGT